MRNTKPLTKVTTASIDYSKDTLITLPKSGKTIEIEKGFPAKMLKKLDNYLSTHSISNKTASMSPNAMTCGYYSTTYWNIENQYKSVSGKYLGIWTNLIPIYKMHNTYGFTGALISPSNYDSALADGFIASNLMYGFSGKNFNYDQIVNTINSSPVVGYYWVDEPERYDVGISDMWNLSDVIASVSNNSSKLFFVIMIGQQMNFAMVLMDVDLQIGDI